MRLQQRLKEKHHCFQWQSLTEKGQWMNGVLRRCMRIREEPKRSQGVTEHEIARHAKRRGKWNHTIQYTIYPIHYRISRKAGRKRDSHSTFPYWRLFGLLSNSFLDESLGSLKESMCVPFFSCVSLSSVYFPRRRRSDRKHERRGFDSLIFVLLFHRTKERAGWFMTSIRWVCLLSSFSFPTPSSPTLTSCVCLYARYADYTYNLHCVFLPILGDLPNVQRRWREGDAKMMEWPEMVSWMAFKLWRETI